PGTWYGKDGMIYKQFMNNEISITDGVQSFIHIDDAIETAIQALNFDSGIYNVADDDPVKGNVWADWYANLLNVTPNINIETAAPFERGVNNEKFKMQGGKLIYKTWKVGMNPIN
ncbi:NAD-dependent epimerase/dehydratase family protein, partial [Staphylococcus cohnii]